MDNEFKDTPDGKAFLGSVVNSYIKTTDNVSEMIGILRNIECDKEYSSQELNQLHLTCNVIFLLYNQAWEMLTANEQNWIKLLGQPQFEKYCEEMKKRRYNVELFVSQKINKSVQYTPE